VQLNQRQLCDVELICNGGFSPLTGFMNEEEYTSVVLDMKLPNRLFFSLPVVFDTNDESIKVGDKLLLKDGDRPIASMVKVFSSFLLHFFHEQCVLLCAECGIYLFTLCIHTYENIKVVESKYLPQKPLECLKCYGTTSIEHPGVVMVAMERGKYYLSGELKGLNKPIRDFPCKTPLEVYILHQYTLQGCLEIFF
jgi:sulfate adenylyltransferase